MYRTPAPPTSRAERRHPIERDKGIFAVLFVGAFAVMIVATIVANDARERDLLTCKDRGGHIGTTLVSTGRS